MRRKERKLTEKLFKRYAKSTVQMLQTATEVSKVLAHQVIAMLVS
jgi:hypothetical protein